MRLIYYRSRPNVGDLLSEWLYSRLIPELLDDDPDHIVLGVGSILMKGYADGARKVTVLGSGARSRRTLPDNDAEWDIQFVRGPKTSALLHGAPYISDPGILLPRLLPASHDRQGLGFVPHFMTRPEVAQAAADQMGARLIDPAQDVEPFVDELTRCEQVVCEAMHGAIIADAYRIPWAGLRLDVSYRAGASNVFKWSDWSESLGLDYQFSPLPLVCYAPFALRKHFQPNLRSAQPGQLRFTLSNEHRLAAQQDQMLDLIESLRQVRRIAA